MARDNLNGIRDHHVNLDDHFAHDGYVLDRCVLGALLFRAPLQLLLHHLLLLLHQLLHHLRLRDDDDGDGEYRCHHLQFHSPRYSHQCLNSHQYLLTLACDDRGHHDGGGDHAHYLRYLNRSHLPQCFQLLLHHSWQLWQELIS